MSRKLTSNQGTSFLSMPFPRDLAISLASPLTPSPTTTQELSENYPQPGELVLVPFPVSSFPLLRKQAAFSVQPEDELAE